MAICHGPWTILFHLSLRCAGKSNKGEKNPSLKFELKRWNKAKAQCQEGTLLSSLGPNSCRSISNTLKSFSPLLPVQVWHFLDTLEILTRSANSCRFSGRPLGMKSHPCRQQVGRSCRQEPGDANWLPALSEAASIWTGLTLLSFLSASASLPYILHQLATW